ncbi:MAG: coproporphyrinogen III oxidase, partial [Actinomycetota bacterium]
RAREKLEGSGLDVNVEEEGTPLTGRVDRGEVTRPEDDRAADQYLWACDRLSASGYRQYEISNFAMPGHECRHNQGYWRREEYLGIGAGAHSLLGRYRFSNQDSLLGYMQKVEREGLAVQSIEIISELEEREEEVMLGLRTSRGVPESLLPGAGRSLCYLKEEGLLQKKGERIVLTPRGMAVSNAVIAEVLCA